MFVCVWTAGCWRRVTRRRQRNRSRGLNSCRETDGESWRRTTSHISPISSGSINVQMENHQILLSSLWQNQNRLLELTCLRLSVFIRVPCFFSWPGLSSADFSEHNWKALMFTWSLTVDAFERKTNDEVKRILDLWDGTGVLKWSVSNILKWGSQERTVTLDRHATTHTIEKYSYSQWQKYHLEDIWNYTFLWFFPRSCF